jgi:dynein light intermediate chain
VQELEEDKRDLERQVNELKSKIEQIEKRNAEQRAVEEKKHSEEIQYLKKTNQQLKVLRICTDV